MSQAFTVEAKEKLNVLITQVEVFHPVSQNQPVASGSGTTFKAIWDTGATNTVITQNVVDALKLKPVSMTTVNTASGQSRTEVYFVGIGLPNKVLLPAIKVTKGTLGNDVDLLIGMDVIGNGDFAVSNFEGKTTFTFRMPSKSKIDFVSETKQPARSDKLVGRNSKCPCGSGKKYKQCCGK